MHSLTICFGPAATVWTLLFKEEATANEAHKMLLAPDMPVLSYQDDFGQRVTIKANEIRGIMLEDMDLSQQAAVERGLHQARTQAKAETKAMTDETIKSAIRANQQGPAVYQPGMPNGRGMM